MNQSNKRNKSLGRGLSAILGTMSNNNVSNKINSTSTQNISLSKISVNPFQPRSKFDNEKLHELAVSIEQIGIIQPITVRKINTEQYQLISGERRFRASKIANFNTIPAYVRVANDEEMLQMALIENIQRENLNPIEIALSYKRLIKECKLTQEACSEKVGKKRSTITNFLRLLKLPSEIQNGLIENKISTGHARALININSKTNQINIYNDIINNGFSVREVEQLSKEFSDTNYKSTFKSKKSQNLTFEYQKIIHDVSNKLNSNVEIKHNKSGKGKMTIAFKNNEDLKRIIKIINI